MAHGWDIWTSCQKCYDDDIVEKVIEGSGTFVLKLGMCCLLVMDGWSLLAFRGSTTKSCCQGGKSRGNAPVQELRMSEVVFTSRIAIIPVPCSHSPFAFRYKPEENVEGCCRHHVGPPIFHDVKKGWTCCEKYVFQIQFHFRRVYDWNDFYKIEGCCVGKHNPNQPEVMHAPSPTIEKLKQMESAQTGIFPSKIDIFVETSAPLKSISEFNQQNPDAPSAVSSLANKTVEPVPMKGTISHFISNV